MKLLLCVKCQDLFRLFENEERKCKCGAIKGRYVNKTEAVYSGSKAIPIIFDNNTLIRAISDQPDRGEGLKFGAVVAAVMSPEFKRIQATSALEENKSG